MGSKLLEQKSRVERLREIKADIDAGKRFSAFELAVKYLVSLNVVYRDIKALKAEKLIPRRWSFAKKER